MRGSRTNSGFSRILKSSPGELSWCRQESNAPTARRRWGSRSKTCGSSMRCRKKPAVSGSLQQQAETADVLKVISSSAFDLLAVFNTVITSALDLDAISGTRARRRRTSLSSHRGGRQSANQQQPVTLPRYPFPLGDVLRLCRLPRGDVLRLCPLRRGDVLRRCRLQLGDVRRRCRLRKRTVHREHCARPFALWRRRAGFSWGEDA
jgi:hypothetical protein